MPANHLLDSNVITRRGGGTIVDDPRLVLFVWFYCLPTMRGVAVREGWVERISRNRFEGHTHTHGGQTSSATGVPLNAERQCPGVRVAYFMDSKPLTIHCGSSFPDCRGCVPVDSRGFGKEKFAFGTL